jgi:hypothetical protein
MRSDSIEQFLKRFDIYLLRPFAFVDWVEAAREQSLTTWVVLDEGNPTVDVGLFFFLKFALVVVNGFRTMLSMKSQVFSVRGR